MIHESSIGKSHTHRAFRKAYIRAFLSLTSLGEFPQENENGKQNRKADTNHASKYNRFEQEIP